MSLEGSSSWLCVQLWLRNSVNCSHRHRLTLVLWLLLKFSFAFVFFFILGFKRVLEGLHEKMGGTTSSAASWQHRQKQVSLRCALVVLPMNMSIIVPKPSGGGAVGVQQRCLSPCICHGSPLILTFYTHVRVLLELAVGKRKRVSPEMAEQFSIAMQKHI